MLVLLVVRRPVARASVACTENCRIKDAIYRSAIIPTCRIKGSILQLISVKSQRETAAAAR